MSLLDKVARMLENRADIIFLTSDDDAVLQLSQLRRIWNKYVINPMGMTPVEREEWYYFSQTILITLPRFNTKKEMVQEQRDMAHEFGRLGVEVIFPTSLDCVIDRLGSEPQDFKDYLARKSR
jgi:hypothetical protein